MRQPRRRSAMVRSASSATVSAVMPPAAAIASLPRAERAGNNGNAIQQIKSALLHVLAGDVFERLPTREPARTIADFDVAGDRAKLRIGEVAHELADCGGFDFGVRVDGDDDFG